MEIERGNYVFPAGFLWGAATASHQVEGNNINDWSEWEKNNAERLAKEAKGKWRPWQWEKFPEMFEPQNYISGQACDHWNRFNEDFDLAKSLGHNAHRLSLEWARIEPEKGKFNQEAINHYGQVIEALNNRGLQPFVTINHFSLPLWFSQLGGWENRDSVFLFGKLVDYVAKSLGHQITFWITVNEPWMYLSQSYLMGFWPPQKKSWLAGLKVFRNLIDAHKTAFNIIKSHYPNAQVGLAENNVHFEGPMSFFAHWWVNRRFLDLVGWRMDFIGLNYYFHSKIKGFKYNQNENKELSDMGTEIYPKGIFHVLKNLKRHKKPIYITENGLADAGDEKRAKFIKENIFWMHKAMREGVDVRGYFYWSLLDNFEWDKGFWPRFGLLEVNYSAKGGSASGGKTLERRIRPSTYEYAKICKENALIL